jgi:hypothetical protein
VLEDAALEDSGADVSAAAEVCAAASVVPGAAVVVDAVLGAPVVAAAAVVAGAAVVAAVALVLDARLSSLPHAASADSSTAAPTAPTSRRDDLDVPFLFTLPPSGEPEGSRRPSISPSAMSCQHRWVPI